MLQRTTENSNRGTGGTSAASTLGANTVPSLVGPMGIPTTTINMAAIGEREIDTEDISNKLSRLGSRNKVCILRKTKPMLPNIFLQDICLHGVALILTHLLSFVVCCIGNWA